MKILITGGESRLSKALIKFLDKTTDEKIKENIQLIPLSKEELDITNQSNIVEVFNDFQFDIILNLASINDIKFCNEHKSICKSVNQDALQTLSFYAKLREIPIIQISSLDGYKQNLNNNYLIFNSTDTYAICKYEADKIVVPAKNRNMQINSINHDSFHKNTVIKTSFLYNPSDIHDGSIVNNIYKRVLQNENFEIDDRIVSITNIKKLAEFILKIAYIRYSSSNNYRINNDSYIFTDSGFVSYKEIAELFIKLLYSKVELIIKKTCKYNQLIRSTHNYGTWKENIVNNFNEYLEQSNDIFHDPNDFSTYLKKDYGLTPDEIIEGIVDELF